jgi:hypothetical protein
MKMKMRKLENTFFGLSFFQPNTADNGGQGKARR